MFFYDLYVIKLLDGSVKTKGPDVIHGGGTFDSCLREACMFQHNRMTDPVMRQLVETYRHPIVIESIAGGSSRVHVQMAVII